MDESIEIVPGHQEAPCPRSTIDKQRYAEQVAILYRNAPFAYFMSVVCAILLVWVQRTYIASEILIGWLLCMSLLTIARSTLVYCYFHTHLELDDAPRWGHYYLTATAFSGIVWGSTAIFLFPAASTAHQVVLAVVLGGLSAGAVPMLASIREVFWIYLFPTLIPLILRLFAVGEEFNTILGVITSIFLAGMMISAQRMHRSIEKSLSLRFENEALILNLERDKAETERLNTVLLAQIDERKRAEQALRVRESQLRELTGELEQHVAARTRELRIEIEERKRAENTLHQRSRALEQSGSMVLIADRNNVIEYVNPRFTEMTGYGVEELLGNNTQLLDCTASEDGFSARLVETIRSDQDWRGELRIRKKSGESYWSLLSISPMQDDAGMATHLVVVGEDLTRLKETQGRMEQLAFYDTLTGLANRRLFMDRLEQALRTLRREHKPLALLQVDVDHFKHINDTLGHDAGDLLLQTLAQRLMACVRQQDTVARLGGDEFIVLLTMIDDAADAGQVAAKILSSLREPIRLPTQEVVITTSVGITLAPDDGFESSRLMKHVDLALYRAKQHSRNTYRFFVEEMNQQAARQIQLESELKDALEHEQFALYYQPIVHLTEQYVMGLEALVRWDHPERGIIPPDQFMKVAEQTGLILPLGEWVLSQACRDQRQLRTVFPELGRIMVNLSSRQFHDPKLLQTLPRLLTEADCAAGCLGLEITEQMLMQESKKAIKVLTLLKDLGIEISVDDFGKGYSSLSYLRRSPISALKIDRTFVGKISDNNHNRAITSALISLGSKLGFQVMAKGVETSEQLAFLQANHCTYGQGYLFGAPLPLNETLSLLGKGSTLPIKQCETGPLF